MTFEPANRKTHDRVIVLLYICIVVATMVIDHQPRFFVGDSISYLSTDGVYMPPDRSWAFGLWVNWLLHATHSHSAYLLVQAILLLGTIALCSNFQISSTRWRSLSHGVFAVLVSIDPLLSLYARFYMSDFLACLLFVVFLSCLYRALCASRSGFLLWLPVMALLMTTAVFTRVAYALIVVVTLVVAGAGAIRCRRPILSRLAIVLALPPLAVASLVAANSVVFADRFPGERFVNKLSGVFLMGTFAPALTIADFKAAGVLVSEAEIDALDLPNYDKRGTQIWGADERSAQVLVKRHLGIAEEYTARVDSVCSRIFWNAVQRDPLAVARVYANTLLMHFQPSHWQRYLDHEIGLTRTLPQGFVDWVNQASNEPIKVDITEAPSLVLNAFRWFAPVYPLLLVAGLLLACWRLLVGRTEIGGILVSAGFIAVLATAPLYTVYVIPRYLLASVFLGYLLWADVLAAILSHKLANDSLATTGRSLIR